MNTPPDPLDPLLDRWNQVPEPPPRLSANVWQRIATQQDTAPQSWRTLLEIWFGRPVFAGGFVAACAVAGLFVAEMRVNHLQRERSAQLARSYLLLIDPLLNTPPESHRP
jgi:hypothetical protein